MNLETILHHNTNTTSSKYISLGTNPVSSGRFDKQNEQHHESSINQIKMAAPFGSESNSYRAEHNPDTARESCNYEELKMCNEIIEKLKSECANLELTVVD